MTTGSTPSDTTPRDAAYWAQYAATFKTVLYKMLAPLRWIRSRIRHGETPRRKHRT